MKNTNSRRPSPEPARPDVSALTNRRSFLKTGLAVGAGGVAVGVLGPLLPAWADPWLGANPKLKIKSSIPMKATAFALEDVRLLDGPFKHAMELDGKYVLSLDADRLLHNFRLNAGLPSTARPLGGWEAPSCELRGHFVGHFMSVCAQMYASTGDVHFKDKGDAIVAGLAECQAKLGSGYLSAFPETFIDRVERRQQVWAPYYTLHKIFAGLQDMYVYCDSKQALEIAGKFGDWVIARNARLSDAQMQAMMGQEHGGMNETLANLYSLTGEKKYLDISLRFNHQSVVGPASQQEDRLTGLHANTTIPKFIGTARQFELTGTPTLGAAAEFFWKTVVNERSYVTGGNSDKEHFTAKEHLSTALSVKTAETCNVYNMLKLTRHLFCQNPRAECADFYERALYNHILASQHPETGMMCYSVPLLSGSHKEYNSATGDFWCCTGTGVENHAKYGDSIYFHDDQTLYANLFIASELNWKDKGLKLRQETQYPDEGRTKFVFTLDKPLRLAFQVRHPFWAAAGYEIRVNGEVQTNAGTPGSYVTLDRTWKSGDTVEVVMPFSLRTEAFRDNANRFAVLNGPIVLCAEVQANTPIPVVAGDAAAVRAALKPIAGRPNSFTGAATLFQTPDGQGREMTLEPFYKIYGNRYYVVYWDSKLT